MHPAFALASRRLADCRKEFDLLTAIEREIAPALSAMETSSARSALAAVRSSSVESLYTGMEGVLKEVLTAVDGAVFVKGEGWHAQLLAQAAQETGERGRIISDAVYERLDELRGFRHVERNIYKHLLRAGDVEANLQRLKEVFPLFEAEVKTFIESFEFEEQPDEEEVPRQK